MSSFPFSQDNVLAVGSDHPFIQVFSTEEGKCICKLEGHSNRYASGPHQNPFNPRPAG